jgi:hypothetical protein
MEAMPAHSMQGGIFRLHLLHDSEAFGPPLHNMTDLAALKMTVPLAPANDKTLSIPLS